MAKGFEKICKMSQNDVKKYVAQRLRETHKEITVADGFVYAQGTFPVLLVAHMDTVHQSLPYMIMRSKDKNGNDIISSPMGIGGDDRCGIYMIFEVLKKFNCSVVFCEDEEIGTIGAEKFTKHEISTSLDFNYIIEFDRKGSNDAVFYDCDNLEFEEFITKEFFKTNWGSFSDISVIAPHLGCAAVNLSCGYYNAHQKSEYVVIQEMEEVIKQACKILERTTEKDVFEYVEAEPVYKYSSKWWDECYGYSFSNTIGNINSDYSMPQYYLISYVNVYGEEDWYEVEAHSKEEAVGILLIKIPDMCFNNIVNVMSEDECY